jgi:tRNA threonylcarbamoyladenosine biosynthesis protein TsaB
MKLLAIDFSAGILSIAVSDNDKIFYSETDAGMKHSEIAMPCIDKLLKELSIKPNELNGVLCMNGPGSFTGLRVGYSIAKALALSLSIPFAAVPTLDCIAYQNEYRQDSDIILAVTGARKNAWFYAFYQLPLNDLKTLNKSPPPPPVRLTPDKDGDTIQIGKDIAEFGKTIILKGSGSDLLFDSLPAELNKYLITNTEISCKQKGYAREIIYIAKINNVLSNADTNFLFSGPEYIRDSI